MRKNLGTFFSILIVVLLLVFAALPSLTPAMAIDNAKIGILDRPTDWGPFNGTIDEVRVSNTAKTADWIKASYLSETDNLISYGSAES